MLIILASLVTGPGFSQEELVDGIERLVDYYIEVREDNERFIDSFKRLGMAPFKEALYAA